ncbi:MAG: recombinase family protein, partial [Oscillospiraceae bacterium]|nr:recombinase family protein [Oscillospiraceae bacterium]
RDVSKKSQSGYKQKQKRGEFCGTFAPYGYIKVGNALVVDEETAPIVKKIFEWVAEGRSDTEIAKKLSELKITPPSRYLFDKGLAKSKRHENTKFWYKTTIMRITTNPAYTGVLAQGKEKSNFLNGGGKIKKLRDEWIISENTHTAIVEKEVFNKAQEIRSHRKKDIVINENIQRYESIFKGLIFCADCKSAMQCRYHYRADGSVYSKFVCNVYSQVDRNGCTKKVIKEDELKAALYSYISKQISLAVDISRIMRDIKKEQNYIRKADTLDKKIDEINRKLQQNQRFRSSLREDYVDGVINEQDYISMKAEYEDERIALQDDLDLLESNKIQQDSMLSGESKCIAEFRKFENEQHLSAQMVSALIERIEVADYDKVIVHFKYRDEFDFILSYVDNKKQEVNAKHE